MTSERMFENAFAEQELPLEAIRQESLRRLLAYWESERQPARWLTYDRLRPERIAYVLSDLAVLERSGTGADGELQLTVRLTGEAIRVDALGLARGKTSADFRPAWFRSHMLSSSARAFARAAPCYASVTLRYGGENHEYERLFLPLVRRGPEPDCLLMAAVLPQALIDLKATLKHCLG